LLGSYRDKALRIEHLAAAIGREALGHDEQTCRLAAQAARLAKTDLTTDMVREFTELQGTMGGIYARAEGLPEAVWKAIYFHYLPVAVEADAEPAPADLGSAAPTWLAVSLADKLDTIVGLVGTGEKPTGSRDPYGLRRAAHGVMRMLTDLDAFQGRSASAHPDLGQMLELAAREYPERAKLAEWPAADRNELLQFLLERLRHALESRGAAGRNVRAVTAGPIERLRPADAAAKVEALGDFAASAQFTQLATAFKRVKNIAGELKDRSPLPLETLGDALREPAEQALVEDLRRRLPAVDEAAGRQHFKTALASLSELGPSVDRFFTDVLVMTDDERLRTARLSLMAHLRDVVLRIGDVSEVVAAEK